MNLKDLNWTPGTAGWYPEKILPPPTGAPGFVPPSIAETLLERRTFAPPVPAAAIAKALQSPAAGPMGRGHPMLSQAPQVPQSPPLPRPRPAPAAQAYQIRKGDNLTKIAKKFGTTVEAIVKANGIKNPDRIYAGDSLIIPKG